MSKTLNWMKVLGAGALVVGSLVGCGGNDSTDTEGGSNNGVSNAIKSPVMNKEEDKAAGGGTTGAPGAGAPGAPGAGAPGAARLGAPGAPGMGAPGAMGGTKPGSTTVSGGKMAPGSKMAPGAPMNSGKAPGKM